MTKPTILILIFPTNALKYCLLITFNLFIRIFYQIRPNNISCFLKRHPAITNLMRLFILLGVLLSGSGIFAQPAINSFTPAFGPVGTIVTIDGSGFSTIAGNNIVYFGAVKAVVTNASSTQLKVVAPPGTTYQPITVTTNYLTAYSRQPFLITFNGCGTFLICFVCPCQHCYELPGFC